MKLLLCGAACDTPKDVWNKLNENYDIQPTENIFLFQHQFHNIHWESVGDVQINLAKFDNIQTKLSLLGNPVDENDLCARLLQTLPKDFDNIYVLAIIYL